MKKKKGGFAETINFNLYVSSMSLTILTFSLLFAQLLSSSFGFHFLLLNAQWIYLLNEQGLIEEVGNRTEEQSSSKDASNLSVIRHVL